MNNAEAIFRACIAITTNVADMVKAKMGIYLDKDGGDFFFCLGGALAKLLHRLGEEYRVPGASDSFVEGFSSYRRYLKETGADGEGKGEGALPEELIWLIDNGGMVN